MTTSEDRNRSGEKSAPARVVPEDLRGDGPCSDCGTVDNIVWFAESVLWNEVIRQGDYVEPILCIPCFVKRVDAAGFYPTGWRLIPDWHWETKDERAARTRATTRDPEPDARLRLSLRRTRR